MAMRSPRFFIAFRSVIDTRRSIMSASFRRPARSGRGLDRLLRHADRVVYPVRPVHVHQSWLARAGRLVVHLPVGEYDDLVAQVDQAGGGGGDGYFPPTAPSPR